MDAWGWPYGSPAHDAVELVVAELAANAATHGRVPGRDAELRLTAEPCGTLVRVEVSDARRERRPVMPQVERSDMDGGRGLALVEALAGEWGVTERSGARARPSGLSSPAPLPAFSARVTTWPSAHTACTSRAGSRRGNRGTATERERVTQKCAVAPGLARALFDSGPSAGSADRRSTETALRRRWADGTSTTRTSAPGDIGPRGRLGSVVLSGPHGGRSSSRR
ncbi:ATP-binding protein [Streptomyces sp. INA 01156]